MHAVPPCLAPQHAHTPFPCACLLLRLCLQLVAAGDMGLAWQAAETAVYLCSGAAGAQLVEAGALEELALLLRRVWRA
jgi:hypothetical protein